MGPNRAVVRLLTVHVLPTHLLGGARRLLFYYNLCALGRLSLQVQARHLCIPPRRPIHEALQATGLARYPSWTRPMS